jgi:hypothetical protein
MPLLHSLAAAAFDEHKTRACARARSAAAAAAAAAGAMLFHVWCRDVMQANRSAVTVRGLLITNSQFKIIDFGLAEGSERT